MVGQNVLRVNRQARLNLTCTRGESRLSGIGLIRPPYSASIALTPFPLLVLYPRLPGTISWLNGHTRTRRHAYDAGTQDSCSVAQIAVYNVHCTPLTRPPLWSTLIPIATTVAARDAVGWPSGRSLPCAAASDPIGLGRTTAASGGREGLCDLATHSPGHSRT